MNGSVLIVDDDANIREVLCSMLAFAGYEPLTAVDGVDALEKIEQHHPDMVILDIMMPNMDGLTACRVLKRQSETANLPVILLSGKSHLTLEEKSLTGYADKYLSKPVSMQELVVNLQEVAVNPGILYQNSH
ncbi:MAG: response regulator [Chloroflexi bacterium]|nr:MAG: response regulator [Chloroflexota bacterium]